MKKQLAVVSNADAVFCSQVLLSPQEQVYSFCSVLRKVHRLPKPVLNVRSSAFLLSFFQ
jgi:hypothetical protein